MTRRSETNQADRTNQISYGRIRLLDVPHAASMAMEIFEEDCYRFERIPVGSIVIDVGACYGEFSIRSAVEKRCRVIACEPCAENRAILEQNKQINGLTDDDLVVSPLAIGDPGRRSFLYRPDHPAGSMFEVDATRHGCSGVSYEVECAGIAEQMANARGRWGNLPICLKLDCEGAEREIFASCDEWIGQVDVIAMEWHDHDGERFRSILSSRGFSVVVEGGGPKPRPLLGPELGSWTWKGEPCGSIGGGLLFAERHRSIPG